MINRLKLVNVLFGITKILHNYLLISFLFFILYFPFFFSDIFGLTIGIFIFAILFYAAAFEIWNYKIRLVLRCTQNIYLALENGIQDIPIEERKISLDSSQRGLITEESTF